MSFMSQDGRKSGSKFVARRRDAEAAKGKDALHSSNEEAPHLGPKSTDMPSGNPKKGAAPQEAQRTDSEGLAMNKTANPGDVNNTANTKAEPEGVDAQAVVQSHGPASRVTVHHNHEGGQHTVVSQHGNFQHTSQHASAKDAHKHAAQLSGEQHEENTDKAPNADAGQGDLYGNSEPDGFSMPSLG
jgi:hypothetical protein